MPKNSESEHFPDTSSDPNEAPPTGTTPEPQEPSPPDPQTKELPRLAHDRRQFTVFQEDEFIFQQATTRTTHWSVPWSDLMMTMFILFLIMFVYQTGHKQLLIGSETEVLGGETTGALEIAPNQAASVPYVPIKPGLPLITAGTIKKVVPIHLQDIDASTRFVQDTTNPMERINKSLASPSSGVTASDKEAISKVAGAGPNKEVMSAEPQPAGLRGTQTSGDEKTNAFMSTIANTIAKYNLGKYASVDIVSGTDVRITLSSDLFFAAGKADLSSKSIPSLQMLGAAIKDTPFMIDIVGHTDDQAPHSTHFPSNWELSVARASSVARFFIEETDMNPNQFVVSGYSSYRPLFPNTSQQYRTANRRIEVIIGNKNPQ